MGTPLKYLITGTGRCGTGLMQLMFHNARISCGHEDIFNSNVEESVKHRYLENNILEAESSWPAAPFIDRPWFCKNTKIVHLVRNPIYVIRSFQDLNVFSEKRANQPIQKLVYEHTDISPSTIDRMMSPIDHYYLWNRLIETKLNSIPNPSITVRLEDIINDTSTLNDFLGVELVYSGEKINRKIEEKGDPKHTNIIRLKSIIKEKYGTYSQYGYL